jgi:S-methylmethionine-dependent homocysteine/selenocysteine methylase
MSHEATETHRYKDLIVFDGGTGREIERRGGPFRQPEWSALALYEDPALVQRVHESYLEAGASAITTNSYAVIPFHLGLERYKKDSKRLLNLSVDLAHQARGSKKDVSIIGSIPPMCGSYEPEKFDKTLAATLVRDFLKAYRDKVDILLLETIGSVEEAEFYLTIIFHEMPTWKKTIPVWISFCMAVDCGIKQTPHLLTGASISDAVRYLTSKGLLNPEATPVILVNCCDVRLVTNSIQQMVAEVPRSIRVGAYPNAFSIPPPDAANHTLREVDFNTTPELFKERCMEWVACGATVLGGCCGVGPAHIRAIASLKSE